MFLFVWGFFFFFLDAFSPRVHYRISQRPSIPVGKEACLLF